MAEIFTELIAYVAAVTGADVTATTYVQGSDADDVIATVTVDGTAGAAAQSAVSQRVALIAEVDGSEVSQSVMLGGSEVSRSVESTIQTGTIVTAIDANGEGQFGSPFVTVGPPMGKQTISIFGVYETSTGRHLVPLITGGIADNSERSDSGGYTEKIQFADRGGRFDRKKISVTFPPGHGFRRDEMATHILTRAGEDQSRLEPMGQSMKELPLTKAEPLSTIQDSLMDIEHRRLIWDRDGFPWNPQIGPPRADEEVKWTFAADDIYDNDPVSLRHNADVITKVIATGTAQELLGSCEPITVAQSFELHQIYAPARPAYAQGTGGYTANPPEVAGEDPILVELRIVSTTTKCETVVRTLTLTYAWYNPETRRYQWDATNDEWDRLGNVFTETNIDDDGPAFDYFSEGWMLVSSEDSRDYYFQTGFQLPWAPSQYPEMANLQYPIGIDEAVLDANGNITGPFAGIKLGTHRIAKNFYAPRTAVKTRSFPYQTPWDEVEPANGTQVFGNKEATQSGSETLIVTDEEIELLQPDATGRFLTRREVHQRAWDVRPNGVQFFHNEEVQSNEEDEVYRKVGYRSEDFVGVGDDQHNIIRSAYDRDNREIDGEEDEIGNGGWLPGIDRLPDTAPDESLYQNEADVLSKSREAIRRDQRQMRIEVEAAELLAYHEENEVEATLEWAENEDEMEFACRMMIAESAAAALSFTLAGMNAYVLEADVIHIDYPPLGLDHDVRVIRVSHPGGYPDGPIVTKLDCLLYGWE